MSDDTKTVSEKPKFKGQPQFLPKLKGQKILVRMTDGRPMQGVLESFNLYELKFDLGRGKKMILFKGAISSIEYTEPSE